MQPVYVVDLGLAFTLLFIILSFLVSILSLPICIYTAAKVKLFFELESFRPIIFSKMP